MSTQENQNEQRADWGEELLWAGVLLALSGVFAAGVLHLMQQAR